jgi:hypothetical protein
LRRKRRSRKKEIGVAGAADTFEPNLGAWSLQRKRRRRMQRRFAMVVRRACAFRRRPDLVDRPKAAPTKVGAENRLG